MKKMLILSSYSSSRGTCTDEHSSSRDTWGANAKVQAQAFKVGAGKGFGKDVGGVVR